ncbi:MAG: carbonic anhydrase [Gammaproteobacteria bacterium]|nr:MAG: carbonic anhydrase [Gammaproteobacteria bacterium]
MPDANVALERLKAGNRRYVEAHNRLAEAIDAGRRKEVSGIQHPFAIILGCSDSRVPAEIVFDQGLGDLFVVRVAGNVVAPSLLGSIEFSAVTHGARLVVVLGHTGCGAVQATVDQLREPAGGVSPNLQSIVNRVRPSVDTLIEAGHGDERDELVRLATRANIRASVSQVRYGSKILEDLVLKDGLLIVGAEYSLETGVVEFFEDEEVEDLVAEY